MVLVRFGGNYFTRQDRKLVTDACILILNTGISIFLGVTP
jgi:hypothetical protein